MSRTRRPWRAASSRLTWTVKLHKEEKGSACPVVALLGKDRRGEIAIRNEDLDSLLSGSLYFTLYTRGKPLGAARAQILSVNDSE